MVMHSLRERMRKVIFEAAAAETSEACSSIAWYSLDSAQLVFRLVALLLFVIAEGSY